MKFSIARLIVLLTVAAGPAFAADKDPVYVVDVTRVMRESIVGKATLHDMDQEAQKRQLGLESARNEVRQLEESLQKQSAVLSRTALQEKQDLLDKKRRDLQRAIQDAETDLLKRNQTEVQKVMEQIDQVIKQIAQDHECEMVIDSDPRVVIYAADRLQLTDQVIEQLNKKKLDAAG